MKRIILIGTGAAVVATGVILLVKKLRNGK